MGSGGINSSNRKRLLVVSIIIFFLFSLLIIQFFVIQVIEGEKWTKQAQKQHFFVVKEPFRRGTFVSNSSIKKGHPEMLHPFVIDIEKFHLYIDPDSIPGELRKPIAGHLIGMLDLTIDEKLTFPLQFEKKSRSRKLAMWLDKELRDIINEWWYPYASENHIPRNALYFVSDYQRSYPFGKLLGQVLHTIQNNKDEFTKQAIPTGGLELHFNQYLKGKLGKRLLMRSPRHSLEMGQVLTPPENGADVYLTINHYLQAIAEEEIAKGVRKSKAKGGWAVMMNPYSGEILALAQYPSFYPPDYQTFFNDPKLIEHTRVKAITDANEPGSVMKAITIAVALKANDELIARGEKPLFDPEDKMETANGRFPGRSKPITDTHTHHFLNMDMAIQKSSNVYVARLSERIVNRLGNEWYREALLKSFGFGEKTGIELPSETRGLLPTPGKKHPNGAFEWSTPTPFSMAFGHNIQVNSIQLLRAYAIFANGGYLVDPTLVRKIMRTDDKGNQQVVFDNGQEERLKRFPRVLSEEIAQKVVRALRYTTKIGGTATRGDIAGFTEAGKTSTAKKIVNGAYSDTQYVGSFVGFAPVHNPAFVLIVTMDEPEYGYIPGVGKNHHGGTCSAPIFKEIATRSLEYLGITPDDPYGYPVGDPRRDKTKMDWRNETEKLQEMYEKWNNKTSNS